MSAVDAAIRTDGWTRTPVLVIGILLAAAAFVRVGGVSGAVSAGVLAFCWFLLPGTYVVAIGHVLLAALTVDGLAMTDALLAELGLLAILLTSARGMYRRRALLVGIAIATIGLLVLTDLALLFAESIRIAAFVLVGTATLVAYGLHRYELVVLGLVEGSS